MEIQYHGANCVNITSKKATVVVDDNIESLGGKQVVKPSDIVLCTTTAIHPAKGGKIYIDQPGEYEVSGVSIAGIAARAHMGDDKDTTATMYKIDIEDVRIAVVGHVYPSLSEQQLESLGTVDVLIVPVGGHGYTLDPAGAAQLIKKIEPKIIVPTQYADNSLAYEVPAVSLEDALKGIAMEPKETVDKLKLKSQDISGDQTQLVVIKRT